MHPDAKVLLSRLEVHEQADLLHQKRVEGQLARIEDKVDQMTETSGRHLAQLSTQANQLQAHAERLQELDEFRETTGQHELAKVQSRVALMEAEQREQRAQKRKWMAETGIALALALVSALLGWWLGRR